MAHLRDILKKPVHPASVMAAFAGMLAIFAPLFLVLVVPENRVVSFLFGGVQIFIFWAIAIYVIHRIESRFIQKSRRE